MQKKTRSLLEELDSMYIELQEREEKARARCWGRGSENRSKSMQREGKGPRPKSCTREGGDDRTRDGGAVP